MRLLLILCGIFAGPVYAADGGAPTDAATQTAIKQTEDMLRSNAAREKFLQQDSNAQKTDDAVSKVVGSKENKDKIYEIAASILQSLAESNGGDVNQMKSKLETEMKNPEKFLESLSPDQREQIRELAGKIESQKPAGLNKP